MAKKTASKRKALGRGLGALIPTKEEKPAAATDTRRVEEIRPNPWQPRTVFDDKALAELADSIRQRGILQPLVVRSVARQGGEALELVSGERRFRAAQQAGLTEVPVVLREVSDEEMLEIALIENIQRENLNPMEEARAFRQMADELGLKPESIAKRVGKDRSTVANALRLLQLPESVQEDVEAGRMTAGHARALAGAGSSVAQKALAQAVVSGRLSVRETERLAKDAKNAESDADRRAAEQKLAQDLGTKVKLDVKKDGSGRIAIQFYNLDQLNGLLERLGR